MLAVAAGNMHSVVAVATAAIADAVAVAAADAV